MSPPLLPFQFVLLTFSGWVNRRQLDVIDYIQEENRLLKERLGGQRIRFTDAERRRLARKSVTVCYSPPLKLRNVTVQSNGASDWVEC